MEELPRVPSFVNKKIILLKAQRFLVDSRDKVCVCTGSEESRVMSRSCEIYVYVYGCCFFCMLQAAEVMMSQCDAPGRCGSLGCRGSEAL